MAEPVSDELREAHGYATRLLVSLMEKHCPDRSPQWEPLPDLIGVLTQLDNLSTCLARLDSAPAGEAGRLPKYAYSAALEAAIKGDCGCTNIGQCDGSCTHPAPLAEIADTPEPKP